MGPSFSQLRLLVCLPSSFSSWQWAISKILYLLLFTLRFLFYKVCHGEYKPPSSCLTWGFSTCAHPPKAELSNFSEDRTSSDLFFFFPPLWMPQARHPVFDPAKVCPKPLVSHPRNLWVYRSLHRLCYAWNPPVELLLDNRHYRQMKGEEEPLRGRKKGTEQKIPENNLTNIVC